MSRIQRWAWSIVCCALLAAGCTILPNDEVATMRDPSGVPEDLLSPTTATTEPENPAADKFDAVVYLYDAELGVMVSKDRQLESQTLTARLLSLFEGDLSEEEIDEGLSNTIPQAADLIEVSERGRTAIVNLNEAWIEGDGDRRIALAQIVFTVTDSSYRDGAIQEVALQVEGQSRPINGPDGEEVPDVSRDDFEDFDLDKRQEEIDELEDATTTTLDEPATSTSTSASARDDADPATPTTQPTDSDDEP